MATTILDNVPRHFAATDQVRYASAYRRRLMDRSILDDILNGDPERVKGYLGSGKGLKVEMYSPDNVKIRDTQPDGEIIYQSRFTVEIVPGALQLAVPD